jgi:hypothetical protein
MDPFRIEIKEWFRQTSQISPIKGICWETTVKPCWFNFPRSAINVLLNEFEKKTNNLWTLDERMFIGKSYNHNFSENIYFAQISAQARFPSSLFISNSHLFP